MTVYLFGHTNQCDPVEPNGVNYNYLDSVAISEMCPQRVEMKYIEEFARYDNQTCEILGKFLGKGKVTHKFMPIQPLYTNICYLNKTRRRVTERCCYNFFEGKESYLVSFKYQGHRE